MIFFAKFACLALPIGTLARDVTQSGATWGLSAISHRQPQVCPRQTSLRSYDYHYDEMAGLGTFAYVVDSGVRVSHEEFENRAVSVWTLDRSVAPGPSAAAQNVQMDSDDHTGHGTHVAGIIASKSYGVAKKATIIAVKVRRNGKTLISDLLAGIDAAIQDIIKRDRVGRAVINISQGGSCHQRAIRDVILRAAAAGITVIRASDTEQNTQEPHLVLNSGAISVGSLKPDWSVARDSRFAPTVNLFAPGAGILSLSNSDDKGLRWASGAPMAAAHVTGVALIFMATSPKTSDQIADLLETTSTKDKIRGDLGGSPNRLVNNNNNKQVR